MSIVLELGIKEGQLGTWRSWGITITTNGIYLVFPLAMKLTLVLVSPYPDPLGMSFTKWSWLKIDFLWYRFIHLKIGLPLWRNRNWGKNK